MTSPSSPDPHALLDRAERELTALYGADAARALRAWMMDRPRIAARPQAIDHRTSILTLYPDHVVDDARPPLQVVADQVRRRLPGVFSHLHVLPFFPADGDDGYAITDHHSVHPRLGGWDEVRALADGRRLICDFVANHVSTAHPLFGELLATGDSPHFRWQPAATDATWGYRVRTTALYQPFASAHGTRWVFCTYGRSQADLDYRAPETLQLALAVLDRLLREGADVLRLDALPHLWKGDDAWGPHHPNVIRLLRTMRCFTDWLRPGTLLFAESLHKPGTSYFGELGAQLGNELRVPLLLLGCLLGDTAPLASWLAGRAEPDPSSTPLVFLNTHDGMHLLPMSSPLGPETSARLFGRLTERGVVLSYTQGDDRRPYEINSPLAAVIRALVGDRDQIAAYVALHAVLLALPGIPQIYFPNLWAADAEPRAHASHPRALNRRKLELAELDAALAAPAGRQVFDRVVGLLTVRAGLPALHPHARTQVLAAPAGVVHFCRGDALEVVANFADQPFTTAHDRPTIDHLEPGPPQRAFSIAPGQVRWLAAAP
jgi:sucrose phosphorylase